MNSINLPCFQCVASWLSWLSIAPVSRRSRVRIPLKPRYFSNVRLLFSNCLNWKIYCDDHPSLSSTTAVQIWIISYILHVISLLAEETNSISCPCSQCVVSQLSWQSIAPVSQKSRVRIPLKPCFFFSGFFFPIFQNCSEGQTNVPEHFPGISESFRKCPEISEDFRGRPEDVSMIHQRT